MNPTSSRAAQPLRLKTLSLTDLIVGDALVLNSRCLRFVSARPELDARAQWRDGMLSGAELQALQDSMTRLEGLWSLLRDGAADALAVAGVKRYRRIIDLLPGGSATGRAAKELLDQTEAPDHRAALRAVLDQWPVRSSVRTLSAGDRDRLQSLLAADAAAWQSAVDLLTVEDLPHTLNEAAVHAALKRSYRKLRRAARGHDPAKQAQSTVLTELARRTARVVAQLELLRPVLSEGQGRQLWYLQRLDRNFRRRRDLALFQQRLDSLDTRSEPLHRAREQAAAAVKRRRKVQAQRSAKLLELAFQTRPGDYLRGLIAQLAAHSDQLVLDDSGLELVTPTATEPSPSLGEITVEEPN